MLEFLRAAVTTNGGTPSKFTEVETLRELVTAYGGTPTKWDAVGLLREAITAAGGTPTKWTINQLLAELTTALGGTPSASARANLSYIASASNGFGAHEYWRLEIDSSQNGLNQIGICEIEMRGSAGGPDLCVGGTPSASSTSLGAPANAFNNDGNALFWRAGSATNEWIQYRFASPEAVTHIAIMGYSIFGYTPAACRLRYSDDGVNWTTAFEITRTFAIASGLVEFPMQAGTSNLWRLQFADAQSAPSLRVGNLEFRSGGTDVGQGSLDRTSDTRGLVALVTHSGTLVGDANPPFTASNADYWDSAQNGFPRHIGLIFPTARTIDEVAFSTPDINASFLSPPKNMKLQRYDPSNDTYVDVEVYAEENGWSRNERRVLVPT